MLAFVSIDKITNELVAVRADKINIPEEIKGVKLTEENKTIYVEGMTDRKDKSNRMKLSPQTNHRGNSKGAETAFDRCFKFYREIKDSFEYKNNMKMVRSRIRFQLKERPTEKN